MTIIVDRDKN